MARWIAVDLDATLAVYDKKLHGKTVIGPPVPAMVRLVRNWIALGDKVSIFTSRVADTSRADHAEIVKSIEAWCLEHIGYVLPVTATKWPYFSAIYDDIAIRVEPNTGRICP